MARPGNLTRRGFLGSAAGLTLLGPDFLRAPPGAGRPYRASSAGFPRQDLGLVEKVVRFAHFDLDAVRELVDHRPALARASWDWGFGDWETPIGAASHTGGREMAELLMTHRARPTLFTFAMLGTIDVVRTAIESHPGVQRITGPHGLTLLQHARTGGEAAADVAGYLKELGDADPRPTDILLEAEQRNRYLGAYELETDDPVSFQIVERKDHIAFRYGDAAPRKLMNQGDHEFHPVGAEAVRFHFRTGPDGIEGVTIRDGGSTMFAARTDPGCRVDPSRDSDVSPRRDAGSSRTG